MSASRIRVTLDIVVDPEAWELLYGTDALEDNAADVAAYVQGQVQQSAAAEGGALREVKVR